MSAGSIGAAITGQHGTLHLNADGSYTYQSTANNIPSDATDVFVYTLKDGDGDLSTTTLTINLANATINAPADNDVTVYEAALDTTINGSDLATGTITGSLGTTSPLETDASNQLNATGGFGTLHYKLVSGGNAVTAGTFGSIQVNDDGSYVYTLTKPVTEAQNNNGPDTITPAENFTYQVTDANGNTTTGTINIAIVDDIPTATVDTGNVSEGGLLTVAAAQGVLKNDTPGADGAAIAGVRAAGDDTTSAVVSAGSIGAAITGQHGTLHLNADGSYTYQSTANNIPSDATDVFVYTLKDGDGDLSTTTLTINLANATIIAPADNDVTVNEAALDTTINGSDLATGTVTGSAAGTTSPLETDASNQLNATGGFGTLHYKLVSGGNAVTAGTFGSIQVNDDGSYVYTLTKPVTEAQNNNGARYDHSGGELHLPGDGRQRQHHDRHDQHRHRRRHPDGDG